MSTSALDSPVVVDGIVSDEKLAELLALQAEYPELDYKRALDLTTTEDAVELAKDIGAMQVRGGYIVIGVDGHCAPVDDLDDADVRPFDEANLTPKMLRWLPRPLELRTRVADGDGHRVVLVYVGRHLGGCAFFAADGQYEKRGSLVVAFRQGDVFWRDGTRSVRMSQEGLTEVIARRVADAKAAWHTEQHELRRQERLDLETAYEGRRLIEGPLGTVNLDMDGRELSAAVLEFLRRGDTIGLTHLMNDARARARSFIDRDEIETELGALLDKLACLAATFLQYEQTEWFDRVIGLLVEIYAMPLGEGDALRFGYSTGIDPTARAPRVWLEIVERIFGLGALAVRRRHWSTIRLLALRYPERLTDYDRGWLRHAITMVSRAQHLQEQRDGRTVEVSLLSLARNVVARLECLRPDGISGEDEMVLTSLAQFDFLWNVVAIADAHEASGRTFYPSFARVRQDRIQPLADRLLTDHSMRSALNVESDEALASALADVGDAARSEGWRYEGFRGWDHTPVETFIAEHRSADAGDD
jgi:hypothetical protein